ncbi:MAG: hypothetical protein KDD21_02315 [Bacteroidetes bacterium]|nr:hypothetical protein [Bacteroidota bacterium]
MLLPLEYHFPVASVSAEHLDNLLYSGYFRTGNYLMRTRLLYFNEEILNTLHIRFQLQNHQFSKRLRKLLKRNNEHFTFTIQPCAITLEKENLYKAHRKRFKGNASLSLTSYMSDNYELDVFNTMEINVYDKNKLVAFSFFDIGSKSIASIIGIFDQDYTAYSLGIYTMLLEIEYAKSKHFQYYYPGYVAYEPSQFNYKLRLSDNFEFLDWYSKKWLPFDNRYKKKRVNDFFSEKLATAKKWLDKNNIPNQEMIYPFFFMGSMYPSTDCVKGIRHLLIQNHQFKNVYFLVEFHPEKMQLVLCGVVTYKYSFFPDIENKEDYTNNKWNKPLLYLNPTVTINNEEELKSGYDFLQAIVQKYLQTLENPDEPAEFIF